MSTICGASCRYGVAATRKFSKADLGWMWHCNRRVRNEGERCWQHAESVPAGRDSGEAAVNGKTLGRFGAMAIAARFNRPLIQRAIDIETAELHGQCLGLTPEQTGEVIAWWHGWERHHLASIDWDMVRDSMVRRALGEKWHP